MTAVCRRAAKRQVQRLLRGASNWLEEQSQSGVSLHSCSHTRLFSSCSPSRRLDYVSSLTARDHGCLFFGFRESLANEMTRQQVRGVKISGSEVKVGFVIDRKGRIEKVLKAQHTTQGRGGASIQVELRDVQTGLKSTTRLRTSEAIEKVFVDEIHYTFLYEEDNVVYLMEPKTFEQVEVPKSYFDTGARYLTDGMDVTVQYFDGKPLSAALPSRVTCRVAEAEPYFKGQTATPTYKKIVLENGQSILAPTFISAGDDIIVDTTDDSYVTRSKA